MEFGRSSCGSRARELCRTGLMRWNRRNVAQGSCASQRRGHRTSPRTPAGECGTARRRGSARWGVPPRRPGDVASGTRLEELSTGSVTGTGQQEGPCDSYSQGPFVLFPHPARILPDVPGARVVRSRERRDQPRRLVETTRPAAVDNQRDAVDNKGSCCGDRVNFGGTPGMSPKPLAGGLEKGIELLPRTPEGESGTARRRRSVRRGNPPRRPGDGAAGAGDEELSTGSVTGTGQQKGPWNSYFRGPFAYFGPLGSSARGRRDHAPSGGSADPPVTTTLDP